MFKCIYNLCALFTLYFFSSYNPLLASQYISDNRDNDIYIQGVNYRNAKQYEKAIECFQSLAENKNVKAQHNLASCFYHLGQENQAYKWFRRAGDQGFEPSLNNLRRMNLLCILMPNELIAHITSYLTLKEFDQFGKLSRSTNNIFRETITRTNFLTSQNSYANSIRLIFKDVGFDPQPQAIRIKLSANSEGPIEIRFRDPNHLRTIVNSVSEIEPIEKSYFVYETV